MSGYEAALISQLRHDLLLALLSLGLAAWGYWRPLPGSVRRARVVVGFGRGMMLLMALAFVTLLWDAYQTAQDLQAGEPGVVTARVVAKDVRPVPFRRNGALYLADQAQPFAVPLERLAGIEAGDVIRLIYAPRTRTVLEMERLSDAPTGRASSWRLCC